MDEFGGLALHVLTIDVNIVPVRLIDLKVTRKL
jgi:hypothetical protein